MTHSMRWSEFFALKGRIAKIKRIAGIPAALCFLFGEASFLSLPVFNPMQTIFGFDPLVVIGITTISGCALGYVGGSALAGSIYRKVLGLKIQEFDNMQRNFYRRITRYRANVAPDPTKISFSFDFYGEGIKSISDYRKWLRSQRKLIRERSFGNEALINENR